MLTVKFNKKGPYAYSAHLDLLRSLIRGIRRSDIPASYSTGFNPHMNIFLTPPMPIGIESEAEYMTVDAGLTPEEFIERFNRFVPSCISAAAAYRVSKNPNLAAVISSAQYSLSGITQSALKKHIACGITVSKFKDGQEIVRDAAPDVLGVINGKTPSVLLSFGNKRNLRIDLFINALENLSGKKITAVKTAAFVNDINVDDYLKQPNLCIVP